MDVQDGVAIVTGSSSGVGAACARQLAEKGCHVVINYAHNEGGALATQATCEEYGVETIVQKADIADDDQCRALANAALDKWGRIDALINNAGTTKFNAHPNLDGLNKQDFLDIYAVNTVGAYQMTRAVAESMRTSGQGSVVNVSSVAGVMGVGSSVAYAASKGALITMTLSLARALGPEIRVNCIAPGLTDTAQPRYGHTEAELVEMVDKVPLGRLIQPEEIADMAIFLCSDQSKMVTGQTYHVNGGTYSPG